MFKNLVKDIAIYGFADFFIKIIAFFTFPIFAHLLSVNDYGILSFAGIIAGFVGMFMSLGLNNAIQRFYFDSSFEEKDRPELVSTGYIIITVWATSLTLLFIFVAYIFRDYTLQKYQLPFSYLAMALIANIPAILLTYSNDTIRLHFKPVNFLIISLCRNLSGVILSIILMKYYNMGLWGCFVANVVAAAAFVPLGIYLTRKDVKPIFNYKIAKTIVKFGYPFVFAGLAYWLFGSMDRWMLGQWSTMEQAGLYSVAFKLGSIIMFINGAFGQAWAPVAIKIMNENPDTYKAKFSKLFTYWFAFLVIIGTVTSFFALEFFHFTTPGPYWEAIDISVWIIIGLVISSTTQLTAVGISISKKTVYFTYIAWITAAINFIINLALIPHYGAMGSAIATTFTYIVLSGGYLYISQKVHWMPIQKSRLVVLCCFLTASTILSLYFNGLTWSYNILLYKLLWIGFMVLFFFYFKIIDIGPLKQILFKRKYA
jgi:O-antigen/teichoic acid export membrane protein